MLGGNEILFPVIFAYWMLSLQLVPADDDHVFFLAHENATPLFERELARHIFGKAYCQTIPPFFQFRRRGHGYSKYVDTMSIYIMWALSRDETRTSQSFCGSGYSVHILYATASP